MEYSPLVESVLPLDFRSMACRPRPFAYLLHRLLLLLLLHLALVMVRPEACGQARLQSVGFVRAVYVTSQFLWRNGRKPKIGKFKSKNLYIIDQPKE